MRVVLVGEESAGLRVMREIAASGHELVAVLTSPSTNGATPNSLWQQAQAQGFRTLPAKLVKQAGFFDLLMGEEVDLLLNIHSLVVLPGAVVGCPRLGCFNLHPGPLPEYAGLNTVSWAIYHGARSYGVTLHKMSGGIDTGEIAYQARFEIGDRDSALTVYSKCLTLGLPLVTRLLEDCSNGHGAPQLSPQDLQERQYFGRQIPENGWISWHRPARRIYDFVRACDYGPFPSPWDRPRSALRDQEFAVTKAELTRTSCDAAPGTVGEVDDKTALVACGDEWLRLQRLSSGDQAISPPALLRRGDVLDGACLPIPDSAAGPDVETRASPPEVSPARAAR